MRRVPSPDGRKASLLATIGPAGRAGLVLSAHTDVVPVEGQAWTVPPFAGVTCDERVYGRGATDMKGFLAVVLANVPRLRETATAAPVTSRCGWCCGTTSRPIPDRGSPRAEVVCSLWN